MTGRRFPALSLPALVIVWLATAIPSLAADPVARATLQTKGTLFAGEQILIDVDVLVPNYFMQPPQFPLFDLPGAIVTLQDGRALNLNETIGDTDYSGVRRTYAVTPERAGTFTLPPATITFGYAAEPGKATAGSVSVPALRFEVESTPAESPNGSAVVATKVTVTQDLDRAPGSLHPGDVLVRTITVRAQGLDAMMIPEPELSAPVGVSLYRRAPQLGEEKDGSGSAVAGTRREVASYVFAEPGSYVLPPVTMQWFDPLAAKAHLSSVPAVSATVSPAEDRAPAIAPPAPPDRHHFYDWHAVVAVILAATAAAALIWAASKALMRLGRFWMRWSSEKAQSEATFFRRAEIASRSEILQSFPEALDAWARRADLLPLESWIRRFGDADTLAAYRSYLQTRYGTPASRPPDPSRERLLRGLSTARSQWLASERETGATSTGPLPPLNPWIGKANGQADCGSRRAETQKAPG